MHYKRAVLYGNPLLRKRYRNASVKQRLLARVTVNNESKCWEFNGAKDSKGYGLLRINKTMFKAHRVSYEEFVGTIPEELFVLHKCDNRKCVNPDHLFLGTHADNMLDMVIKGRSYRHIGSKHHQAKLTESDIHFIRQSLLDGELCSEIAKLYSVSRTTISSIKRGKTWNHVTENNHGI